MDVTEHKLNFNTMATNEVNIAATIVWKYDEGGIINEGSKRHITGKATYDFDPGNQKQPFESYLEYLVMDIIKTVGKSGENRFKLETEVPIPESGAFAFSNVALHLEMDVDDKNILTEVLGLIKQSFAYYQTNDKLPEGIRWHVALAISQKWN